MSVERRYHRRIPCDFSIQLVYRGRRFTAQAIDVTSHGMGVVQNSATIPPGTLVELEFSLGKDSWLISGLVVHTKQRHMGIMFRVPQPELLTHVRERFPLRPFKQPSSSRTNRLIPRTASTQ